MSAGGVTPGPGSDTAESRHGLDGVADAGAFLARLVRLEPAALVRLRPTGTPGRTALWGRLPWGVLAVRTVSGPGAGDVTVAAGQLLAELAAGRAGLPARRDAQWRWPLPPAASRPVENLPGEDVRRLAEAAAGTLREAATNGVAGRAVGQRTLRDALLDHVAVVVTPDDAPDRPVEVTQRLVQGLIRMGFLGATGGSSGIDEVRVRAAGRWVALVGPYGAVWSQKATDLAVRPLDPRPKV
ncbi:MULTISPECIES: hypothetical protein [Micromonospora]|uniref:Uncharacterized protein n=1 Tax=Micromonospora maris TaxID=1003110 RepID=A0A9X0LDC8_9ACTN|nr:MULTISPECIES: hypothetical protein [Micromonospora]AEB46835.1 hypothetical protein VAB18032_28821 [Micromonospora maris AB-18-032]KUJ46002.1 hypothetical protein ADL17_23775 [Micromonospora maris]RUL89921.1 hypothetical protein EG812_28130 [Verrucosispora sp. FIM060022]